MYPTRMIVQEIKLETVDFADERFRMSYFRDPAAVRRSVAAVGLLNPPLLWQDRDGAPYGISAVISGYWRAEIWNSVRFRRAFIGRSNFPRSRRFA